MSGALPENVNYAVKSSLLLSFLESVPEVAAKLKEPSTKDSKFEDVVHSAEKSRRAGVGVLSDQMAAAHALGRPSTDADGHAVRLSHCKSMACACLAAA